MQIANQYSSTIERAINSRFLLPEAPAVEHLIPFAPTSAALRDSIRATAEALLRIPDESTLDTFIADKLSNTDWRQHLRQSKYDRRRGW